MTFFEFLQKVVKSPSFKFIVIMALILMLSIPLLFVYLITEERKSYASSAEAEIQRQWGAGQSLHGPFIVVPSLVRQSSAESNETVVEKGKTFGVFLPSRLSYTSDVNTKNLKRGIFEIPVYTHKVDIAGQFKAPNLSRLKKAYEDFLWDEASFVFVVDDYNGYSSKRPYKSGADLVINKGESKVRFRSGTGFPNLARPNAIQVPITEELLRKGFQFDFQLMLNGSKDLRFTPSGGETKIAVKSNWPHPSFTGTFLPDTRKISEKGFDATWSIPSLARNDGLEFIIQDFSNFNKSNVFGVRFYQPVGYYNLIERSLKYAIAFIAVVFFAVFVMELISRKRVHWIQYIFVGLALIIFYLVLLGTSEHIGFDYAYGAAALATSLLIGSYVASTLKSVRQGFWIFFLNALIYAVLYTLLNVEDYAMLFGSISAFILLAVVMFATRNVDWSGNQMEKVEEAK